MINPLTLVNFVIQNFEGLVVNGIQVSRVMSLKTSHISLFVLVPCAGTKLMKIEHI
jgi:hypothetical protein